MAWLLLGGAAGFILRGETAGDATAVRASDSLPSQAAVSHAIYVSEVRHPVEVGVDQEAHLVAWLSNRLGAKLNPPNLQDVGYQLIGGRLLPGDRGKVAQFLYQDGARTRLTLYVRPNAPKTSDTGFRYANEGGIDVFYWIDGPFGYALSGNTGRDDMLRLATLVYRQNGR